MKRDFIIPENFEDYGYVSQLVQAYGIIKAIEAHRRAMPRCMGTLYWQLNDCWPVISWSSLDYYNRWKALHYFVREAYKDILISFEVKNDEVDVYIVSDFLEDLKATLQVKVLDFSGEIKSQTEKAVLIPGNTSQTYKRLDCSGISKTDHLVAARVSAGDLVMASNIYYFVTPKDLALPDVAIGREIIKTRDGYQIMLTTNKLAKNVFLSTDQDGFFSDNYFDLIPGEPKSLKFKTSTKIQDFEKRLEIISLNNTNQE